MLGLDYFKLTIKHKWYVFKAGLKLKVPIWQLLVHDLSKLSIHEYKYYQQGFFGNKDPNKRQLGWFHHQKVNKHHWDYWIIVSPHKVGVQGGFEPQPLPMPEKYIREMVADWVGAGIAYTGSTDIQEWVNESKHKMKFHPDSEILLKKVLAEIGIAWS